MKDNTGASLDLPRSDRQMAVEKWIRGLQKRLEKTKDQPGCEAGRYTKTMRKAGQKRAWYWKADGCVLVLNGNSRNYFADSLNPNQHATAET